jgi:hypothetical protein
MQRKWYTRGHVSQLITTPSLWHNQQNRSVEAPITGDSAGTGDCCCKQGPNIETLSLYNTSSISWTILRALNKDNQTGDSQSYFHI